MSREFPGFHGATVEQDEERNQFRFVLPLPGAPNDRVVVTTRAGKDVDPQIVYDTGKRDVLQQAAQSAPDDDKAVWEERFTAQQKIVRRGQIVRPYRAGQMDASTALGRLVDAGHTVSEASAALDTED